VTAAEPAKPVSAAEANKLFQSLTQAPALVLAVSGGPDSTALLALAARWRAARKNGPKLIAVTVDHGLRAESDAEARAVKRLARRLGVQHRILRWRGQKPKTGLQQAARTARYRLLGSFAGSVGAHHILTAHTIDDQVETVLFRMSRGSGISGLCGMREVTPLALAPSSGEQPAPSRGARNTGIVRSMCASTRRTTGEALLVRPFLGIPKARLIATLQAADIPYVEDPSNRDPRFARARLRNVMPALAREGLDAGRIALFARRLQRAETALEAAVDAAVARAVARGFPEAAPVVLDPATFFALPAEIAIRLLGRAVARTGDEVRAQLGKLEALYDALASARRAGKLRLRRTLAGAMITLNRTGLTIEMAPPRRTRRFSNPSPEKRY
jgi:tRNA(Ile)-lysidine synthase